MPLPRRDEAGASLVLALLLVGALGFIGLASLDVANESFREDRAAQTVRTQLYGASGALDVLVAAMRTDASWGRDGTPCAGLTFAADDGSVVQATCVPVHGSGGLITGGFGTRTDRVADLVATISGARVAHARVDFVDAGGTSPGLVVRVRNWTTSV